MSIRLQVVMAEAELAEIRKAADAEGLTVSEWVRASLRRARRTASGGEIQRKLDAIRAGVRHAYPTADVDQMVAEISRGYGEGEP
jgi:hypothetical protein